MSVFFGGIPTDIDVKKITDTLGLPDPGTLVLYETLEEIIDVTRKESRFRSVVGSWRKQLLRDHNLITEGIRDEGIKILENKDRGDHCMRQVAKGSKAIKRGYDRAARTQRDGLTTEQLRVLDHVMNLSGSILNLGRKLEKSRSVVPSELPENNE